MDTLCKTFTHQKDSDIEFFETGHKYEISTDRGTKYLSVTTWVHQHFWPFNADLTIKRMMSGKNWNPENKYWGMTPNEIKKLWMSGGDAALGTALHARIERFMNNKHLEPNYTHKQLHDHHVENMVVPAIAEAKETVEVDEWDYFIDFVKAHPDLKPYRTEWVVFHDIVKIAGSIDMVYENDDGTLSIYDWKRCKEIVKDNTYKKFSKNKAIKHVPDTNYWHYALQLNIYKRILEDKYNKVVRDLMLVRIHPNNAERTYELIPVPDMKAEIDILFEERKAVIHNS